MKFRIVFVFLLAMASLVAHAAGTHAARLNYKTHETISANGLNALYDTAKTTEGAKACYEMAFGAGFEGNLEIVSKWVQPAGKFLNTGLDRHGVPIHFNSNSATAFVCYRLRSKVTGKEANVRDICLNTEGKLPIPAIPREIQETSNSAEVDVDINLEVNIDFHPSVTATATASTAPITITINNSTAAAPLMMMGSAPANQYVVVVDKTGFLSLGYVNGGGTKINICNSNVNTNNNTNTNTNNNSNSNSNSNANTNVVNVGGGHEPEPLANDSLMCSLHLFNPPRQQIAA